MQRNKQLIRETLELIATEAEFFDPENEQGVTQERMRQIDLLVKSGFLTDRGGIPPELSDYQITWQGYDLLDDLREEYGEFLPLNP